MEDVLCQLASILSQTNSSNYIWSPEERYDEWIGTTGKFHRAEIHPERYGMHPCESNWILSQEQTDYHTWIVIWPSVKIDDKQSNRWRTVYSTQERWTFFDIPILMIYTTQWGDWHAQFHDGSESGHEARLSMVVLRIWLKMAMLSLTFLLRGESSCVFPGDESHQTKRVNENYSEVRVSSYLTEQQNKVPNNVVFVCKTYHMKLSCNEQSPG